MLTEMLVKRTRKMSLAGFCNGAVAGLVSITPASGFVTPYYSLIFGFLAGALCFFATKIKKLTRYNYDDACDVFAGINFFVSIILPQLLYFLVYF